MRKALCKLSSMSAYSQSRPIATKKPRDEKHDEFEARIWRERCHVDENGEVYIPPMAFKNCLAEAAKYKSIQIPGKGKSTYTKHFEAGTLVLDPSPLGVQIEDVEGEQFFVPADGRRGGSTRVWKTFPVFRQWSVVVPFFVLDDIIDEEVFHQHLVDAGQFIGIGRFRPRNNGFYGRFAVGAITWSEQ